MFTHSDIVCATGARACGTLQQARGVSVDSRTILPEELFVALTGPKFDGHSFLHDVAAKDAAGAIVNYETGVDLPQYIVDDTLIALQALAAYHRDRFMIPVLAITGTNGKTTVKELVGRILSVVYEPVCTEKNYNNHIGVPLALLKINDNHTHAVIEMGMNHAGEIRLLSTLASPTIALITNIGHAHLEFFKSIEDVAKAKLEILDGLARGGTVVLPVDGPCVELLTTAVAKRGFKVLTFGNDTRAAVSFLVTRTGTHGTTGMLCTPMGRRSVQLRLPGSHNAANVAAAVAAAIALEPALKFEHIAEAIEGMDPVEQRCQVERIDGVEVIADCYNANIDSVTAALEVLGCSTDYTRKIALLGEMLELGERAADCHCQAGKAAAKAQLAMLVAVGPHADDIVRGAREAGMADALLRAFPDVPAAAAFLAGFVQQGDCVLVKGSRGAKLETAIDALRTARMRTRHA